MKHSENLRNSENWKNSENIKNSENLKDFENLTISERVLRFAMQRIKQDISLKIQKVRPKAKCLKKNKNNKIPTHPMTMPQAAGKNPKTYL